MPMSPGFYQRTQKRNGKKGQPKGRPAPQHPPRTARRTRRPEPTAPVKTGDKLQAKKEAADASQRTPEGASHPPEPQAPEAQAAAVAQAPAPEANAPEVVAEAAEAPEAPPPAPPAQAKAKATGANPLPWIFAVVALLLVLVFGALYLFSRTQAGPSETSISQAISLTQTTPPTALEATKVPTTTSRPTEKPTEAPKPTEALAPTAQPQAAATEVPTAEGEVSCTDGKILAGSTRTLDYFLNSDDGDPFNYWVVISWEASDKAGSMFLALGQPMKSLDFEAPHILGATYRVEAETLEGATCVANALATDFKVEYKLFIGDGDAPQGYTKDFPETPWKMSIWGYTEKPIEPGWDWTDLPNITQGDQSHTYGSPKGYIGLQLWYPNQPGAAYHVVVAPGWKLSTDNTQGSGGIGVGGDVTLAMKRFLQASVGAETRDQIKTLYRIFCGPTDGPKPDGYKTDLPTGWSCSEG